MPWIVKEIKLQIKEVSSLLVLKPKLVVQVEKVDRQGSTHGLIFDQRKGPILQTFFWQLLFYSEQVRRESNIFKS